MKNALDGLISRLDMSKRTSELEDIVVETFKTKKQRKKTEKSRTEYSITVGQL